MVVGLATAVGLAVTGLFAPAAALGGIGASVLITAVVLRRRVREIGDAVEREIAKTRQVVVKELRSQAARVAADGERWDTAQRRILAVVENERLAAADRHQELLAKAATSVRELTGLQRDQTREVEALLQLYRDFRPRAPMPPSGRWAVDACGLLELRSLIERQQPKTVLELGSGTSTVWIAYALEGGGGRLITIDHSSDFAAQTRAMLSLHALENIAEVRHAPLQPLSVNGLEFRWYAQEAFADLSDVDLLVVDGPPGSTGPGARYPALHMLETRLSATATIVLDDAGRSDEQDIVRQWVETFPGLVQSRGIFARQAVLTYSRY
jgi:predicted O-methyltransferase YrrM